MMCMVDTVRRTQGEAVQKEAGRNGLGIPRHTTAQKKMSREKSLTSP